MNRFTLHFFQALHAGVTLQHTAELISMNFPQDQTNVNAKTLFATESCLCVFSKRISKQFFSVSFCRRLLLKFMQLSSLD